MNDAFDDAIFKQCNYVDIHHCQCYRKGKKPRLNLHPKYPLKVYVWVGIRTKGATDVCTFSLYCEILQTTLVPLLAEKFHLPQHTTHWFIQDNNPKHVSWMAQAIYLEKWINWFQMPPESPDINPIKNIWHELKKFIWCDRGDAYYQRSTCRGYLSLFLYTIGTSSTCKRPFLKW